MVKKQNYKKIILAHNRKTIVKQIFLYLFILILIVIIIFPFYWLLLTSLKPGAEARSPVPEFIPTNISLQNYIDAFKYNEVFKNLINSLIISISTTVIAVLFGSMAAYSLSKTLIGRKLRHLILFIILLVRILPPVVTVTPYFLIMEKLKLFDTHIALIISYTSFALPFVIWLMMGFFMELPSEIEKAATIDGCSIWQRFFLIAAPMTLPGIAVTSIFAYIMAWNEFLFASFLTSGRARTLPIIISTFITDREIQVGQMMAVGTVVVIPVLILAILAQKYLVRGLTFGAVKG